MNSLRNIFSSRALNYLRQNGQNALVNITQPVDGATTGTKLDGKDQGCGPKGQKPREPLFIPKTVLDATLFKGKALPTSLTSGSISPTTLKTYRRMSRKVDIVYLCKLCNTRNSKQVSEAAYTSGVVILQCEGCAVDHLIIDNVGWFANKPAGKSFDQVLAERSSSVKVIKVNQDGDLL